MLGRTHDLAGFTALTYIVATQSIPQISFGTGLIALGANFVGALTPDIDQPTADLWRRLPAGSIFGKILSPILGGHRFISHSIVGVILFGIGFKALLDASSNVLIVDQDIVWRAFMIGFVSHLVMDSFTKDGVPWLFPIPIRFGIPPFRIFRLKTGGILEKYIIFPGLIALNGFIYYSYYPKFLELLHRFF